jgi:hypothetical protein
MSVSFLIVFSVLVQAYDVSIYGFEWKDTCKNTTHLLKQATIYLNNTIYTMNQTVECTNGCSSAMLDCKPSVMSNNLWLIGITFLIIFMIIIAVKMDFVIGLPMLMVGIVLTAYFISMDFFTSTFKMVLVALVLLQLLLMYVLAQRRTKKDEDE